MARKKKNTVDYFPHECSHGKKMFIVESQFGNDGYAVWFKVLEQLGLADNHYLDLREDDQMMYLESICKVENERFIKIINLLAKIGAINKMMWEHKVIYSDKFIENIKDLYDRRKSKCMQLDDLCSHLSIKCEHKQGELAINVDISTQSKVKDSKVNQSKVNKRKGKDSKLSDQPTLSKVLKDTFLEVYLKDTGNEFYWSAKEATNLKKLITSIKFSIKQKKGSDSTDDEVITSFDMILKNLPKWNKENNFSVSGINGQYNNIINQIRNGKSEIGKANRVQGLLDRVDEMHRKGQI